jgi:hypothetical protein
MDRLTFMIMSDAEARNGVSVVPVCNAHSMRNHHSMARSMRQWSIDHEPRHHFGFAMLETGWRVGPKERRLHGGGANLADPDARSG